MRQDLYETDWKRKLLLNFLNCFFPIKPKYRKNLKIYIQVMRHDLYEIDRKRKLLLDEVEAIRKKKYEELDALKRIEVQKTTLLKELMNTQEAIDKHR